MLNIDLAAFWFCLFFAVLTVLTLSIKFATFMIMATL